MVASPPRRPALGLALAALAGAVLGPELPLTVCITAACAALAACFAFRRDSLRLALALVLVGTGGAFALHAHLAERHVKRLEIDRLRSGPAVVEGVVKGETQRLGTRWRLVLDTHHGLVQVELSNSTGDRLLPGARARCWGRFVPWRGSDDPGAYSAARAAARAGIGHRFQAGEVRELEPGRGPAAFLASCRRHWRQTIHRGASSERRGFLAAVLLGDRGSFPTAQRRAFARTGAAHLLSISGLHVGLIVGGLLVVMRLIGASPTQQRVGGVLCLALYLAIVGARVPTVRAAIGGGVFLLLPGRGDGWNRLAVALTVVLAWDPLATEDVGFQLSFGTVAGMFALAPLALGARGWRRVAAFVLIPFVASTPLLALCFGMIPTVALVLGAPSVVVFAVMLAISVAGLAIGVVLPELGASVLSAGSLLADLLVGSIELAARVPGGSVSIAPLGAALPLVAVGALALGLVRREAGRASRWQFLAAALLFAASANGPGLDPSPTVLVRNHGRTLLVNTGRGQVLGLGPPRGQPKWLRAALGDLRVASVVWVQVTVDRDTGCLALADGVLLLRTSRGARVLLVRRGAKPPATPLGPIDLLVAPGAAGRSWVAGLAAERSVFGITPIDVRLEPQIRVRDR